MSDLPETFVRAAVQPTQRDVAMVDGIGVRAITIPAADTYVPQHSHRHPHVTMLAIGRMRVWADGRLVGDFEAPHAIRIPAGVKHTMLSLTDNVLFYCIHNIARVGYPEELEQHRIVCDGDCGRCSA